MASGHVNRTQRPNTWLHRPSLRREDSPCQLGAVHTWPKADVPTVAMNIRFRGQRDRRYGVLDRRDDPLQKTTGCLAKSNSVTSTPLMSHISLGVCVWCA
jgi:hypothetical protein